MLARRCSCSSTWRPGSSEDRCPLRVRRQRRCGRNGCRGGVGPWWRVLAAAEDDDVGAIHDDDEERTYRVGLVVTVSPWSSSCRELRRACPVRRREGAGWLRAREDPAGL